MLEAFGGTIDTAASDEIQKQNRAHFAEWRHKHAVLDFFGQIPEDIRRIVQAYRERRWHILNLLARCPGTDELHHSNPAICYMLASNWVFRKPAVKQPMRAARSLVRRPQRQILDWLGFPATEAVRKILAKINPESLSVNNLLYLRTALADQGICKLLSHLPTINTGVLFLVNSKATSPSITPRLLAEVAADPKQASEATTYRTLCDTLNMAGMTGDTSCPQLFGTIPRLIKVHDRLTERLNTMFDNGPGILQEIRGVPQTLPDPPFPGTETITPITTTRGLFEEGKNMHHCVGSYARMVADRRLYVYRVTSPVRATAAIYLKDDQWIILQTTGPRNVNIPDNVIETIRKAIFTSKAAYAHNLLSL